MQIRPETESDFAGVATVNNAVFGSDNEAYLISLIRESDLYVPELSLVALDETHRVVGHVMFSFVTLETGEGDMPILDLAPLAVHPDHQNRGIGSALTRYGLRLVEERGEPLVLVEGIPAYYPRFGFERASRHGITPPSPVVPDDAFMVKLLPSYDPVLRGKVRYPEAFYLAYAIGPQLAPAPHRVRGCVIDRAHRSPGSRVVCVERHPSITKASCATRHVVASNSRVRPPMVTCATPVGSVRRSSSPQASSETVEQIVSEVSTAVEDGADGRVVVWSHGHPPVTGRHRSLGTPPVRPSPGVRSVRPVRR